MNQKKSSQNFLSSTPIHELESNNSLVSEILSYVEQDNGQIDETLVALSESETESESSKSTNELLTSFDRLKWTGILKKLEPKDEDSLYYKIFHNYVEIEDVLIDLINSYDQNKSVVILSIFQLLIDLCGYNVTVNDYYNLEDGNVDHDRFIKLLESDLLNNRMHKEVFLFMKPSKIQSAAEMAISKFLSKFILISFQKNLLFDDIFCGYIFGLIRSMTLSYVSSIRVVGVIISVKLVSEFTHLFHRFKTFVDQNREKLSNETMHLKERQLRKMIDCFYSVFEKNCLLSSADVYVMKAICTKEMINWIILFPTVFLIKRKCLSKLVKLITDEHELVQESALDTLKKIVALNLYQDENINRRLMICINIVSDLFSNVNPKIATNAVKTFTDIIRINAYNSGKLIANKHKLDVVYLIFQENFELSCAAAEFMVVYCHKNNKKDESLLILLLKIFMSKPEYLQRVVYFVESFYEFCPELKNCNIVLNALNALKDPTMRSTLILVVKESLQRYLTGKFSIKNPQNPQKVIHVSSENHCLVANSFISSIKIMVRKDDTKEYLLRFFEILTFIDYKYCINYTLMESYQDLFNILAEIFQKSTNVELLEVSCKILYLICEKNCTFDDAEDYIERLRNKYADDLLENLKTSHDENLFEQLRQNSLKASILFSEFDLRTVLKWELIFDSWKTNVKLLKYMFVCCKWSLIWQFREIVSSEEENVYNTIAFSKNFKEFVNNSLKNIANIPQPKRQEITLFIFNNLSDLYCLIDLDLKQISQLRSAIQIDSSCQDDWTNFLVSSIIESRGLNLQKRQKYFTNALIVISSGGMPFIKTFSVILKYYAKFYKDFGHIFDLCLSKLITYNPVLPVLILNTLVKYFELILEMKAFDHAFEPLNEIMSLSNKISTFEKLSRTDITKLLNMGIRYALENKNNAPFLSVLKHFVHRLNKSSKHDLIKQLESYQVSIEIHKSSFFKGILQACQN